MRWITTNPVYNSSRILTMCGNGNFSQNAILLFSPPSLGFNANSECHRSWQVTR